MLMSLFMLTSALTSITEIRATYLAAVKSSAKAQELYTATKNNKSDAVFRAYYGTALALQAKHGWSPAYKYNTARTAATELNAAVGMNSNNLEIRFLRFSFEANAPSILAITLHTKSDKDYILSHLDRGHPMWPTMKSFLSTCSLLTVAEKAKL
jgi:hypothetical protein